MEGTQKDFKKKKTTLVLSYVVSFALLGIVALDFMGYTIPLKPLIAHAATYISPMNGGRDYYNGSDNPSGYWPPASLCPHTGPRSYYNAAGPHNFDAFWYACID